MADTYSTYMELLLMQDGSHPNTWGDLTNTNLSLIDQALSQVSTIAVSNSNYQLTMLQAATCQARSLAIAVTGTLSAPVAIELPVGYPKLYVIFNNVTNTGTGVGDYPLTVQVGAGAPTGAVVALSGPSTNGGNGYANLVYSDGANVYGANGPGDFALLNEYQAFTAGTAWTPLAVALSGGGPTYTGAIDPSLSNQFYLNAPASATAVALAFANTGTSGQLPGQEIQVVVTQNGAGGMVPTWPSGILWPNGTTPTWTVTPNGADLVTLLYTNVGGTMQWLGQAQESYGATGGGTYNVKISQSASDVSVLGLVGAVLGSVTVNVTVNAGVVLSGSNVLGFGLDCSGLPAGSVVNLYNFGYIVGMGGFGGPGIFWTGDASFGFGTGDQANNPSPSSAGQNGGAAVNGPNGGTLNIYNSGHIWGGGGGGGGGGYDTGTGAGVQCATGAGGGGAGAGKGGTAWQGGQSAGTVLGGNGGDGNVAPNSSAAGIAGGAAGAGAIAGGAGGNWGTVGASPAQPTHVGGHVTRFSGIGGTAGAAVAPNGAIINTPLSGDIQGTT